MTLHIKYREGGKQLKPYTRIDIRIKGEEYANYRRLFKLNTTNQEQIPKYFLIHRAGRIPQNNSHYLPCIMYTPSWSGKGQYWHVIERPKIERNILIQTDRTSKGQEII